MFYKFNSGPAGRRDRISSQFEIIMNTCNDTSRQINVNKRERIISVIAGSFLLYKALTGKKRKLKKAMTAALLLFRGYTGSCPLYYTFNIDTTQPVSRVSASTSLIVDKPRDEVYRFWRNLDNLPYFMSHLESVKVFNAKLSEWKIRIPGGLFTIDWKSEIIADEENEYIAWKSLPGSQIENSGMVWFMDSAENSTELKIELSYQAPGGNAGAFAGKLFNPVLERMIREDIKNFKTYMETGEIVNTLGETF